MPCQIPYGEERDQRDARPRDDRPRVGDHAGQAREDPERQEERDAVDGEEGGGERRVDRADERQPAQVAADRLVDLCRARSRTSPRRSGRASASGRVDQAAPEDQHEDHQEGDGDGGGDAAQQIAERVQDRRRRALQHLGEAALGLRSGSRRGESARRRVRNSELPRALRTNCGRVVDQLLALLDRRAGSA